LKYINFGTQSSFIKHVTLIVYTDKNEILRKKFFKKKKAFLRAYKSRSPTAKKITTEFMGFIVLPRLTLWIYIFRRKYQSPFLTFLTYYYFLHARLINPPPRFYENVVINTRRMPVFLALPNSVAFPSREKCRRWIILPYFRFGGGKKGDEHTFARAIKSKKRKEEEMRERKRKNVNEPASVAPARMCTAECSLTAWRRDARRRQ